ncbi:entericidin A/B family lipoprotein [Halovulum sp. GXIMD14794]|jgi:predicted small secreted protein
MMRVITLVLILTTLAACETVKGVGRDVTNAGQAMDNVF